MHDHPIIAVPPHRPHQHPPLQVPPEVTVHTSSPAVDLLYALYFYLT